ncbi:MAG: type IV pili methyl-accepting chemotaxis transducer N-terminal domain-containing protein [Rhizobacter sp.]|nr:type IV pili methyl-accepting chemotaxis transducer N-terminal domain-containing protein [Rhizobacter sp.]
MTSHKHWSLGARLVLAATPFLLLSLLLMALTLWVSWQLDGGAAAVNEAGRMRMQAYRMSLSVSTGDAEALARQAESFDKSLAVLREGDPERPLFVPWDDAVLSHFASVEQDWAAFRQRWVGAPVGSLQGLPEETARFSDHIDAFVADIELTMSHWTRQLHLLELLAMALALLGATVLLYVGYVLVLEPVRLLKDATEKIQHGDFGARVDLLRSDEFGTLAEGFNRMAEHLQSMYRGLEAKVAEKTALVEEKRERMEALYDVTSLVAKATTLQELADGFTQRVSRVARADGVALRWSDETNRRYLLLASQGLPESMREGELCVMAGDCHCGAPQAPSGARVIPIHSMDDSAMKHCAHAGFEAVVSVPIRLHDRLMGELNLFYHAHVNPSEAERSLLEALAAHLASGMENLRLSALAKEAAVSQERTFIARELHDSIAQSLAFLKIQVQLMRDALASGDAASVDKTLGEIDVGVRESYGDVRELLMHFRTRTNTEDIEPALATTLRKFEHQSGIGAELSMRGNGMPLSPDLQVQVLHIVQEALSNVRKHAGAHHVWLDVQQHPVWRFQVRDDGQGFATDGPAPGETHVGLRIMGERAQRIGARLEVVSEPGHGTSVTLTLPASATGQTTPARVVTPPSLSLH